MFRKLALAAIAFASIVAAAPASAHGFHFGGHHGGFHGFHGGHHHFHGGRIFIRTGYATPYSCWRIVRTPYGPRRVNVCY